LTEVVHKIIEENGSFPNNPILPILHYKRVLVSERGLERFASNGWKRGWENSIYPFHHFHSNTHEVLGVESGSCNVQIGGEGGEVFILEAGDVLLIPAGVSHKNVGSSSDFRCVGAYPLDIQYDMHRGSGEDLEELKRNIAKVPVPKKDPVYGNSGPLFEHWHI
jgi:uncharacterized protein YjlB